MRAKVAILHLPNLQQCGTDGKVCKVFCIDKPKSRNQFLLEFNWSHGSHLPFPHWGLMFSQLNSSFGSAIRSDRSYIGPVLMLEVQLIQLGEGLGVEGVSIFWSGPFKCKFPVCFLLCCESIDVFKNQLNFFELALFNLWAWKIRKCLLDSINSIIYSNKCFIPNLHKIQLKSTKNVYMLNTTKERLFTCNTLI